MNPTQPAPTPVPIHDITGGLWFFPYPIWVLLVGVLVLGGLIGLVIWLARRARPAKPLTPRQRALRALEELRREGSNADAYAFGVKVSDALRTYIRDQHGQDAVTRTSIEFLESLRNNPVFTDNEKAALAEFLEAVDLLKYARLAAGPEEIQTLLELGERLVQGEQPSAKA